MKICKSKLSKILFVLKNENKYNLGDFVIITKNNGLKKYDKYVGKIGYFTGIEYWNKEKPFKIQFPNEKEELCFADDEFVLKESDKE